MTKAPILDRLLDELRANFLPYLRKAYGMLPEMDDPRILDIGCGSGLGTIELTRLSNGTTVAIDIDEAELERLRERAREAGLEDRISTKLCSLHEIDLPGTFDILWSEGSIQFIGFEKGLRTWRLLLRPGGCLVIHAEQQGRKANLAKVPACGYDLIGHFHLPDNAWWDDYFTPLEARLPALYETYKGDNEAIKALDAKRKELDMVEKDPEAARSMFYILRRSDRAPEKP